MATEHLETFASSDQRVPAQVCRNQSESWYGRRTRFRPVVTFLFRSEQKVTAAIADRYRFRSHLFGTRIEVLYDRQYPTETS
ncbi:DUF3592 domain-containing protein [Asanoa sp. NPDC049518]|uniref:DUF3592 domain-containing protein n=1 Tax=unclassified Asanoa TaxID=2685164 RepID=UPI0034185BF3